MFSKILNILLKNLPLYINALNLYCPYQLKENGILLYKLSLYLIRLNSTI